MPTPQSNQLTRAHRRQLDQLASVVEATAREIGASADVDDIDGWWSTNGDRLVQRVRASWSFARGSGSRYLRQHAALNGTQVDPEVAEWIENRVRESLYVTGPVEFKRHMAITGDPQQSAQTMQTTLAGSAMRQALAGERDTVTRTISSRRNIVGWRRVTDGSPCYFCSMLVGRGAVYDETTVQFQAHDSCGCTAEPLYRREDEPPEIAELQQQWQEHGGTVDRWRDFWDSNPDVRSRYAELASAQGG